MSSPPDKAPRFVDWCLPVLLVMAVSLTASLMTLSKGAGTPGDPLVAVFPPWWSDGRSFSAVAASGASIAGFGFASWLVVAVPDDPAQVSRLRHEGAVILLNALAASLCMSRPEPPGSPAAEAAERAG